MCNLPYNKPSHTFVNGEANAENKISTNWRRVPSGRRATPQMSGMGGKPPSVAILIMFLQVYPQDYFQKVDFDLRNIHYQSLSPYKCFFIVCR
jgi:hypothetical protein